MPLFYPRVFFKSVEQAAGERILQRNEHTRLTNSEGGGDEHSELTALPSGTVTTNT